MIEDKYAPGFGGGAHIPFVVGQVVPLETAVAALPRLVVAALLDEPPSSTHPHAIYNVVDIT